MVTERLSGADRQRLLQLARRALEARVRGELAPAVERGGGLDWPLGAFVTIHCRGELRGCLGRIEVEAPLAETVVHLAGAVSDSDPRFEVVRIDDLPHVNVEISVLTPAHAIASASEIDLGRHGVIVEQGARRGLLLPQVAPEHGWDRETLLEHACRKASLPPDAWRRGATISVFEADVFGEALGPEA